jgi:hypothetical protein
MFGSLRGLIVFEAASAGDDGVGSGGRSSGRIERGRLARSGPSRGGRRVTAPAGEPLGTDGLLLLSVRGRCR